MISIRYNCLYCGHTWVNGYLYRPPSKVSCPVCAESKMIKAKPDEKLDVFGYNTGKKDKDAYIKRDNDDDS